MTRHSAEIVGRGRRQGVVAAEAVAAFGVLGLVMMMAAEISGWSAKERLTNAAQQQALDEPPNALEMARAQPFDALTSEWAATQKSLQESGRLPEGKLTVTVEPEPNRPRIKRVTAVVSWKSGPHDRSVRLVGLVGARTAETGGRP